MEKTCGEIRELAKPVWSPSPEFIATTNIAWLMNRVGVDDYDALHAWSIQNREAYWGLAIERLGIRCQKPFDRVLESSGGPESPRWLPGTRLNIVESCFTAPPDSPAILHQAEGGDLKTMTVGELATLTNRVAANLVRRGFRPGDALAILMPMTVESVAIYLGIIQAGCVVVGIADSFRPKEIATRLRLSNAVAIFTQDVIVRDGKTLPLYANVLEASEIPAIVIPALDHLNLQLRPQDCDWQTFLDSDGDCPAVARDPDDVVNILFSSGTTGDPKAIPWTHVTPIKCAADSHFHQNVQPGNVVVWPTNLGWMMGPWLIFSSLMNRATMGLYQGAPTGCGFGQFVRDAGTTMLGVIPSLVKTWRNSGCLTGIDWTGINVFSSTGECSRADDMRWLMELAGGKPLIEYCGGTEVAGAYITSTLTKPSVPGTFNTPTLGTEFVILNEEGDPTDNGELFLIPPSIGFSTKLLNLDHHDVYYAETPPGPNGELLRRHGDQMQVLPGGIWRAQGRMDDTMNLGGIKVSSAEIEAALQSVPQLIETAAIAVSPTDGPSQLVIYAVCANAKTVDATELLTTLRNTIKRDLNPLFKVHDVVVIDALPRTASNKVMRRVLRDRYLANS